MAEIFTTSLVTELLRIDEKLLVAMRGLSKLHDISDYYDYTSLIDEIKLFYKKELHLISQIPKAHWAYNNALNFLATLDCSFLDDVNNSFFVISRVRGIISSLYLNLALETDFEFEEGRDDVLKIRDRRPVRDNLLCEYMASINECIKIADKDSVKHFFNNILLYNCFINSRLFDYWVRCNFDFDKITFSSDEDMTKTLGISAAQYGVLKSEVAVECIQQLLPEILADVDFPKGNIMVQDGFFNFKFLLTKLPDDIILELRQFFDNFSFEIDKFSVVDDVISTFYHEFNSRSLDVNNLEENEPLENVDLESYNLLISLIKLEDELFDTYQQFEFGRNNSNVVERLSSLVERENTILSSIDFASILPVISNVLNNDIWIFLSGDNIDYKANIIVKRINNLFPVLRNLRYSPVHNSSGFEYIHKNHLIRSLSAFRSLAISMGDGVLGKGCIGFYKYFYFINPDLFSELLVCNGNDLFVCDISDDIVKEISSMDDDEYQFDKNEYLYDVGTSLISGIIDFERDLSSVSDLANFFFMLTRLGDVIDSSDIEYVKKLYGYLNSKTSLFSPLRRRIRKLFIARFLSDDGVLKKNVKAKRY
ncbi:MAG: hypothetical protein IKF82_04935 [Bacilli bacterium]|nr:hypothetical protein [Bacilli bacterium]